jgi:hypothetical protein
MSYRPMVQVSGKWAGNGVRFATEEEALSSARDLMSRWFLVENYGSEYSEDPVNCAWDESRGNVHLEVVNGATC